MDENVLPDENPDSPLKQQGSLGKNSSNHKPALGQRSPLKDIANHPSEARTVKKDIKFDAVYRLHEHEGWHEGTEIATHIDRTAHHKFAYEVDEDIRISSDMMIPALAVGKLLHRDAAKFREVTAVSLEDSESEYESTEDLEEIEKPFIQKIVSPLTPAVNSTLLQATSSANCTPDRSDDVFENSLLNSFENMKIAETDELTLEENFHDACDVMENIVKLSPHSRKMSEENRSTEAKITEQPTASSKKEIEILPDKNEYSCVVSLDKKDSSQCRQSVTERAVDVEPLRKETTEKKEAMICTGKERLDELVENVDPPDQKCDQMNFLNKLDDTKFDPFTKKMNMVNSPNKMDALFVTEGETSCEMAVTTVVIEARETVLQKEGIVPEKKDKIMEKEDTFLEKNDRVLESKCTVSEKNVTVLVNECNVLEKKDTNSEEEDTYLEMEDTASEKEGPSLKKEFTAIEKEETSLEREEIYLEREETLLEREDASLNLEKLSLGREDSPLQKEDTVLVEMEAKVSFKNGGPEIMMKDEGTSLQKGHKVNFLNLEDPTFNPVTTKSYVVNSPDKQDSAYSVQSATEEEICDSSTLMILPKSNTTDDSSGKELLDEIRKDSIPQQSEVDSCGVNLHNKMDDIHISESVVKETPNDKSFNSVTKKVESLDNECLEEPLENEGPSQWIDSPSKLCINFDPLTIRATVSPPGEEDNTVIHVEEMPNQKQKTEVTPEKNETSSLSLEKVLTEESEENEDPPQKKYQVDFPSNVYNLDCDPFTTKLSIINSLEKKDNTPNLCSVADEKTSGGKQVAEKKISLSSAKECSDEIFNNGVPCPQKGYKMDFQKMLNDPDLDPFRTSSAVVNSPDGVRITQRVSEEIASSEKIVTEVMNENKGSVSHLSEEVKQYTENGLHSQKDCCIDFVRKVDNSKSAAVNLTDKKDNSCSSESVSEKAPCTDKTMAEIIMEKESVPISSENEKDAFKDGPTQKSYQMDFLSNSEDFNCEPFTIKSANLKSPNRTNVTSVNNERTQCQKPEMEVIPKNEILPVSSGKEWSEETLKYCVSDQKGYEMYFSKRFDDPNFNPSSIKSSIVNSPDTENFKPVNKKEPQSQTSETEVKSKEMFSELPKEKVTEEPVVDEISHPQKVYQIDFVNMLNDPNLNNFTSTVVNPPDGSECTIMDEEEMHSKKQEMGTVLEKTETSVLEEVVGLEDNTSSQKGYEMNFLSKLDDPNFDAFSTRSSIVNSPVKKDFTVMNDEGTHESETGGILAKKETSLLLDKIVVIEDAEKDKCSSQKRYQMDSQNNLDEPFTTKSDILNSPEKKEFSVVNEKETQSQKPKTVVTPEKEVDTQLKSEKKETSLQKKIIKESVKDDSTPKKCYHMDFLSKLDDTNFDPFKTKAAVQNSPVREENAFNTQMKTKKETSPDYSVSKVMLEKKSVKKSKHVRKLDEGKTPVSQESNVRDSTFDTLSTKSAIVNSPNKKEFSVVDKEKTKSQKAKTGITPKRKQEKMVICKKETLSSQKEVIEAAVKDGLPPQKCYQMDFLSKLDDPNLDPFATKASVVNSPEKKDLSRVNEEETQSQKLKTGIISEKKQNAREICKEKETKVSLQKVVVEAAVKDSAPLQKCYQMSNLDDPTFDPFRTKAAVQNSPLRKENAFNTHMETEEKTNPEEYGLKGVTEERYIKKLEKMEIKSDQSKSPVFQEDSKRDCHKKVDQNVNLKSEEIKKVVSVVTPSICQMVEKKQASTAGADQRDVFSPIPKGQARTQGYPGVFNFEEEFTSANDFFNTPEDLDVLGTHGTEGDKLNLVRNSLYMKFDPLVSGRQSLAPYLAQQIKGSELDPRRCSGLISFSPSPIKRQRNSDTTGTPVRALLSTRADETVVLDATDLDNTTVTDGGNTTFVSCNQTFNNTVICSSAPDSANETIIHQPVVNGEKMVTEREMNEKLKNMELIMQDNELRKCREYEEVQKSLKQQIMENGIALTALEEENSALKSSIQQMQDTLTKILQQDKAKKKEHRNQLQLLENQYELKCAALQKECQQYQDELKKSEVPFFDLVKKYERLREVLECLRRNEESLKSDNERLKTKMAQKEENFKTVIQTYEDKLGMTENEICSLKQNCQQDLKKASVMLKKAEVKILSLTEMVEKLNTERERLTDLLEDITNSMGTTSAM